MQWRRVCIKGYLAKADLVLPASCPEENLLPSLWHSFALPLSAVEKGEQRFSGEQQSMWKWHIKSEYLYAVPKTRGKRVKQHQTERVNAKVERKKMKVDTTLKCPGKPRAGSPLALSFLGSTHRYRRRTFPAIQLRGNKTKQVASLTKKLPPTTCMKTPSINYMFLLESLSSISAASATFIWRFPQCSIALRCDTVQVTYDEDSKSSYSLINNILSVKKWL